MIPNCFICLPVEYKSRITATKFLQFFLAWQFHGRGYCSQDSTGRCKMCRQKLMIVLGRNYWFNYFLPTNNLRSSVKPSVNGWLLSVVQIAIPNASNKITEIVMNLLIRRFSSSSASCWARQKMNLKQKVEWMLAIRVFESQNFRMYAKQNADK